MRLVLVHGISQEGRDPHILRIDWLEALRRGWRDADLKAPDFEASMPYYGDELEGLAAGRDAGTRTSEPLGSAGFQIELLAELASGSEIELGPLLPDASDDETTRGLTDWASVRAAARLIEDRMPVVGDACLRFVRQADAYLNAPPVAKAIDAIVKPALSPGPVVVVAHSLGTVVAYALLRSMPDLVVPLFLTIGSPLGLRAIQSRLHPLTFPLGCRAWKNVADARDVVALRPTLDGGSFGGEIVNLDPVNNRFDDPHSIIDYISHPRVATAIHAGLLTEP